MYIDHRIITIIRKMIDTGTIPSGRIESAHWQSGIERMSTATPGSILVEIHSSRTDASCEVIEDGDSIFIVFWGFIKASVSRNQDCLCKVKKNISYWKHLFLLYTCYLLLFSNHTQSQYDFYIQLFSFFCNCLLVW